MHPTDAVGAVSAVGIRVEPLAAVDARPEPLAAVGRRADPADLGTAVDLHAAVADLPLLIAVGLAGVASVVIVALGVAAWLQRGSRSYLLVALALATLLARSAVAAVTIGGLVAFDAHHTLEHALDFVMAALVLAAVYYARSIERSRGPVATDGSSGGPTGGRADRPDRSRGSGGEDR